MMPLMGFPKTTVVGPFWLKLMTSPEHPSNTSFAACWSSTSIV